MLTDSEREYVRALEAMYREGHAVLLLPCIRRRRFETLTAVEKLQIRIERVSGQKRIREILADWTIAQSCLDKLQDVNDYVTRGAYDERKRARLLLHLSDQLREEMAKR